MRIPVVSLAAFVVAVASAAACSGKKSSSSPTPTPTPSSAGVQLTWTLEGDTSHNQLTCGQVSGATTVDVAATSTTNVGTAYDNSFPCTAGTGQATGYLFGSYTVNVSLLDAGMAAIGSTSFTATFGSSPCDAIVSGSCIHNRTVQIPIPGQ